MGGFKFDTYDTINQLRINLRDRYKDGHAVLKELLQNADDALASQLHVAWLDSLPGAEHPLLQGPLLFIVNDGPFSSVDARAIHRIGTGSKGHQEDKIGKFGLGLKSVFHLCEAFFYLSDPQEDHSDSSPGQVLRTDILNPWYGERYTHWDTFTGNDQQKLIALAMSLFEQPPDHWFGICLPLRLKTHCQEHNTDEPSQWAIEPNFFDQQSMPPQDLFSRQRVVSLMQMLPMMTSLRQVTVWEVDTRVSQGMPQRCAHVTRSAMQHVDWRCMQTGCQPMSGLINVVFRDSSIQLCYAGIQAVLGNEQLRELQNQEGWPWIDSQTSRGYVHKRSVMKQHVAVVVLQQPGTGTLSVDRAVFLPLGDPPHAECHAQGTSDFELMLHGYFFVDAGRQALDLASEQQQPTVRQRWNQILYQQGTMALLIPALAEYVKSKEQQPGLHDQLLQLTRLLQGCQLWRDHRQHICAETAWCYRVQKNDSQWTAVNISQQVLELPGNEQTNVMLPLLVFPYLDKLSDRVLTFDGLPRLHTCQPSAWDNAQIDRLLDSVRLAEVFHEPQQREYLLAFCSMTSVRCHTASIKQLLRRMYRQLDLSDLRKCSQVVGQLTALLPENQMVYIPFVSDLVMDSTRVFEAMIQQDTEVLPVPEIFVADQQRAAGHISANDVVRLLRALVDVRLESKQADRSSRLLDGTFKAIIQACRGSIEDLHQYIDDLPLFAVRVQGADDRRVMMSFQTLKDLDEKRLLFTRFFNYCPALQACLAEDQVHCLADSTLFDQLNNQHSQLPWGNCAGCCRLLCAKPMLKRDVDTRLTLLKHLASEDLSTHQYRAALRYLVHGQPDATDDASLYIRRDDIWSELIASILDTVGQAWRLIDASLAEQMNLGLLKRLDILSCDPTTAAELYAQLQYPALDVKQWTDSPGMIERIIRDWPDKDLGCLKHMPVFTDVDGQMTIIDDRTFVVDNNLLNLDASIRNNRHFIIDPTGIIRKRGLAPILSDENILRDILRNDTPSRHAIEILNLLPDQPSNELRDSLRRTNWLPVDQNGSSVSPAQLVLNPALCEHVNTLHQASSTLWHVQHIPTGIREHHHWPLIQELALHDERLYQALGEAVGRHHAYGIGREMTDDKKMAQFFERMSHVDEQGILPAVALLKILLNENPEHVAWIARHVLTAAGKPLSDEQSHQILVQLASYHQHRRSDGSILELFNRYLRQAMEQPSFRPHLASLQLLNRENHWTPANRLTYEDHNIAAANLLHASHCDALGHSVHQHQDQASEVNAIVGREYDPEALRTSAAELGAYLQSWRNDDVPGDALTSVVAMLGDYDDYPQVFEQFRDQRDIDTLRRQFISDADPQQTMTPHHFCIDWADPQFVRAANLLGQAFDAAVNQQVTCLFDGYDGRHYFPMPMSERCHLLQVRRINPDSLATEQKLDILGNTVKMLCRRIYRQVGEHFDSVWNSIIQVGQLDIEIAQMNILDASAVLLESQLSAHQSPRLKQCFSNIRREKSKQSELMIQRRHVNGNDGIMCRIEEDMRNTRNHLDLQYDKLRQILMEDRQAQALLVSHICQKLEGYNMQSIPFELFQNADDAVCELDMLCPDSQQLSQIRPDHLRQQFVVSLTATDDQMLMHFMHWGRGINQYQISDLHQDNEEFKHDLERMLVIQGSGKQSDIDDNLDQPRLTGRFGLGFKSVFFVCDQPKVFSGSRSRFRVLAGVYPQQLETADEQRLKQCLEKHTDHACKGTVIELALRAEKSRTCKKTADHVIERFLQHAGFLTVFARRIRQCVFAINHVDALSYQWSPTLMASGIEAGKVTMGWIRDKPGDVSLNVLVFRMSDQYSAVLFQIGPQGVCSDKLDGVPEIWVTTPTRDSVSKEPHAPLRRVLVNGNFDLNSGRTQLRDDSEKNRKVAAQIGRQLGKQLCFLYDLAAKDWLALARQIGVAQTGAPTFWISLWETCTNYANRLIQPVLYDVLFGNTDCGMYQLIRYAQTLPTGLTDTYACLTSLGNVRWQTSGLLTDPEIWEAAQNNSWFKHAIKPGTIISQDTCKTLEHFVDRKLLSDQITRVDLLYVISGILGIERQINPTLAAEQGLLISRPRMQGWPKSREVEGLQKLLGELVFHNAAGDWRVAGELLSLHAGSDDEAKRAALAPKEYVLDTFYDQEPAMTFFLACRSEMKADARQLAQWTIQAQSNEKREAAMRYLATGSLSTQVGYEIQRLCREKPNAWLNDEDALEKAMPADDNDRVRVRSNLGQGRQIEEQIRHNRQGQRSTASHKAVPPDVVLKKIHQWWLQKRQQILAEHDRKIYGRSLAGQLQFITAPSEFPPTAQMRKPWLKLFMLGAMHRIGRVTHDQNRGFLDLCEDNGWLDPLATKSDDPKEWFKIVDAYLDKEQANGHNYFHWMNQLLAYYQIARYLPKYALAFSAVTRPGVNLERLNGIKEIEDLRQSHIFAGSTGFDAPPCSRVLGLGSHFILRECIRFRMASDPNYHVAPRLVPHAYVPSQSVRQLLAMILENGSAVDQDTARQLREVKTTRQEASRLIAQILQQYIGHRAEFDGCFDIPLLVLKWEKFQQDRDTILGQEMDSDSDDDLAFLKEDTVVHQTTPEEQQA